MSFRSGLIALLLLPWLAAALAHAADDPFRVRSAWVNVRDSVFEVHARVEFPADPRVQRALDAGASVHFDIDCQVVRQSRYWLDSTLVDVTLTRELSWNGLTQRYVLRERESSETQSFATIEEALVAAGEVDGWPVVVEPQLDGDASYQIRVRAGYRRGNPARLRGLLPWLDGWNRNTEWHAWALPR